MAQRAAGPRRAGAARHPGDDLHRPAARLHRERRRRRSPRRRSRSGPSRSAWPPCATPTLVREFADIARQEYCAVGIRAALHPTLDLATEPRWGRQSGTFGQDPDLATELARAYLEGFQQEALGPGSVACTTKHFPGGGPQKDGEDAHFPYGREQVYPGGRFDDHLEPFPPIIAAGTAAIMPYYGMPIGLEVDGEPIEEVGFGYNSRSSPACCASSSASTASSSPTGSWSTTTTSATRCCRPGPGGSSTSTRAARMELILDAGADQFGGEECVDLLLDLVAAGPGQRGADRRVGAPPARGEVPPRAVRRPLRRRGRGRRDRGPRRLPRGRVCRAGGSVTVLANGGADAGSACRWRRGCGSTPRTCRPRWSPRSAMPVDRPEDADVALVRLLAPFEPRSDLFLESWFHQGSLDFPPGLVARLARIAAQCPLVLDVALDRPAVLTPLCRWPPRWSPATARATPPWSTPSPGGSRPGAGCRSTCRARWTRSAQHPEDVPGYDDPLFRLRPRPDGPPRR